MRPISYEIRRTLTSKFVILMIVAIIGLSSLLAYESAATFQSSPLASRTPSVDYGYYFTGSNITVVTYSYEPSGQPYSGLTVFVYSQNDTSHALISNQAGFANATMPFNKTSLQTLSFNYTYSTFGRTISIPKTQISVNAFRESSGYTIVPGLIDNQNTSNLGFQVLYVGPNGSRAPQTNISVATYKSGYNSTEIVSNASYTLNTSSFTVLNVFPGVPDGLYNQTFGLVVTSNGQNVIPTPSNVLPLGRISTYTPMTEETLQSLVFSGIGPILGFLIPILGVFAAYLTYGKDRTTGVLESVLKRPVTRRGLISSRFLANSVSIVVSVIISMVIAELIIQHYFTLGLSTHFSLFFIWTYVVEGLSFLALIYMFTHIVKSQGALLGVSIAVYVVLALFWSIIPLTILAALRVSPASSTYIFASVGFNYASPSGYSALVQFLFTNHIGLFSSISANPAAFAVTQPLLIFAGILWIAVPFMIGYYLAGKYD